MKMGKYEFIQLHTFIHISLMENFDCTTCNTFPVEKRTRRRENTIHIFDFFSSCVSLYLFVNLYLGKESTCYSQ